MQSIGGKLEFGKGDEDVLAQMMEGLARFISELDARPAL